MTFRIAHDDDDRRNCLPIQIRYKFRSLRCVFLHWRDYELRPRNVRAPRPPFVAHAPHDREVSLAPSRTPAARLGSRSRAPRVSRVTDHPNGCVQRDYARAEDLTRRDHGAGPHAGEAGASRRHASALVSRAPARPAPRPARARVAPLDLRRDVVSNASRTRLERASSLLTSRGGCNLSSLLRRRIEHDRPPRRGRHDADLYERRV